MIQIDYTEAQKIREKYPDVHIRRTASKYYVEEVPKALKLIGKYVETRSGARAGKNPRRK